VTVNGVWIYVTGNYNPIANSHTLLFTTARTKSFEFALSSPTSYASVLSFAFNFLLFQLDSLDLYCFNISARIIQKTSPNSLSVIASESKALLMIVEAPWYVPNTVIQRDLQTPTVTEEIHRYSSQYSARPSSHPNGLVVNLMEQPDNRRLQRHLPNDLPTDSYCTNRHSTVCTFDTLLFIFCFDA
jgi:hypothetical protein